jgi:hypothetical protein
MLEEGDMALV